MGPIVNLLDSIIIYNLGFLNNSIEPCQLLLRDQHLKGCLQLVLVLGDAGDLHLGTLALAGPHDDVVGLGTGAEGIGHQVLPMVEHALGESLARGGGAQDVGEPEGL